jgi:hypothetical protein
MHHRADAPMRAMVGAHLLNQSRTVIADELGHSCTMVSHDAASRLLLVQRGADRWILRCKDGRMSQSSEVTGCAGTCTLVSARAGHSPCPSHAAVGAELGGNGQ